VYEEIRLIAGQFLQKLAGTTRPKAVPKEVKIDVRIGTSSIPVFAINDLRFRRM